VGEVKKKGGRRARGGESTGVELSGDASVVSPIGVPAGKGRDVQEKWGFMLGCCSGNGRGGKE